jgi:uncharacterized protein involved in exopolysaccharide biosynthesis
MGILERLVDKLAVAQSMQAAAEAELVKLRAQEAQAEADYQKALAALAAAQVAERAHRHQEAKAMKDLLKQEAEIDAQLRDLTRHP